MERPQIDGTEAGKNRDILLMLRDGDRLVGTLHSTMPQHIPALCGLSGMCVRPEYRGRDLSKMLLTTMLDILDGEGVKAAFLGTDNPVAARLYAGYGFRFYPGSNVMARFIGCDALGFENEAYRSVAGPFAVEAGSPKARIPMIPLVLAREGYVLMDCNAQIMSTSHVTQRSCMGLYQRYEDIARQGGGWFCAWDCRGTLGGMASAMPTKSIARADFFTYTGFDEAVPMLIDACRERFGPLYFTVSPWDAAKRRWLERLGYRESREVMLEIGPFRVPCLRYVEPGQGG